jgi:superfamily I DNA and RNA helicase
MASPLFYSDVDNPQLRAVCIKLEEYSKQKNRTIYLLKYPKSELEESKENFDNCFILLSPDCKILLVSYNANADEFEEYKDEVESIMNYLYSKYEYRVHFGRFSKWKNEIVAIIEDVQEFSNLDHLFDVYNVVPPLLKKNVELLITLCTGSINDINRVKNDLPETLLDQVKQKIQSFDGDQTRFIYQELAKPIIKIQGLSGTGKTELLLHKIKELYQKNDNFKIFVTCHNKILADTLKMRIPAFFDFMKVTKQIEWNERFWCANAWGHYQHPNTGLYSYICSMYSLNFYSFKEASFDWACKQAIEELKAKYPDAIPPKLDYIFIDECQDFKESFFDLCSLVTSRQVFLAGDIFQSIFAENITKDYTADYFLTKCYRTDPKTLMFAHALGLGVFEDTPLRWLSNENWEACGYTCEEHEVDKAIVLKREPVRRFVSLPDNYESVLIKQYSMDNIYNQVNACIHDILRNNTTCTIEDICIILLDNNQNTYAMANMLEYTIGKEFSWKINKAYESKKSIPNTLLVSNRNNVKGLEYPFVICLTNGLHDDYTYRNAIYTMLTRSFLQTIFMVKEGDNGLTERIMQGYAEIMQEQKMTIRIPSNDDIERIATRFKDAKRRPLKDIIKEAINELGVDEQKSKKMLDVALTMAWTDCSEGEIRDKLETLNRIW